MDRRLGTNIPVRPWVSNSVLAISGGVLRPAPFYEIQPNSRALSFAAFRARARNSARVSLATSCDPQRGFRYTILELVPGIVTTRSKRTSTHRSQLM